MSTSASSLAEASSRLRILATTSGLVANTRAKDVARCLVRAMRWRLKDARVKLGLTLRGLFLIQELTKREMARRQRRNVSPQVSLGSENCVMTVFTDATSLDKACFSSTNDVAVTTFSPAGRIRKVRVLAGGMGVMVDAGLSSLCTTDSMAMTCSSISSTRGKNESTTESSIP